MKEISHNALLMVVDLQNAINDDSWGRGEMQRNNPNAEENVLKLLNSWRKRCAPVLHVKHMSVEPDSTYRPGQYGNEFQFETAPIGNEPVLEKSSNSAFINTGLEKTLKQQGVSEIVIAGVITNNSVEATARMSGNLGFQTTVVSDACFTFGLIGHSGDLYSANIVHDIALGNLRGEYAQVLSTMEILQGR